MPPRTTLVDEDGQPCYFRSDEDDTREYYHYEEPSAKHLIQVIKEECGYEIWEDELWRKHVKNWVPCEELSVGDVSLKGERARKVVVLMASLLVHSAGEGLWAHVLYIAGDFIYMNIQWDGGPCVLMGHPPP